jgi:chloride channel 7
MQYNELASLMNVRGTDAVRQLLSRGSHKDFGFHSLFAFLSIYFVISAAVAGSALSSGLLIPMLLMGACIGRICGLAAVYVAYAAGHTDKELMGETWRWIDPGLFAAVGAGAFLGGGTRQPLSSAVILVETTGEVRFLLPILLAISAAKWASDFFMPGGLYQRQLDARRVPFLPAEPPRRLPLRERAVSCIMCPGPVVCVEELGTLREAASALQRCSGHSFPVVRGGAVVGLISREHLSRVVAAAVAAGGAPPPRLSYPTLEGRHTPDGQRPPMWPPTPRRPAAAAGSPFSGGPFSSGWSSDEDGDGGGADAAAMALRALADGGGAELPESAAACSLPLDLLPYVNLSATTVGGQSSALRAYTLFRTLGLRHLPVLDERGRAVGMVRRRPRCGGASRAR